MSLKEKKETSSDGRFSNKFQDVEKDVNVTLNSKNKSNFSLKITDFNSSGSLIVDFSEPMMDQTNGVNITDLKNSSLIKLWHNLTKETNDYIQNIVKKNKTIEKNLSDFSWEFRSFLVKRMILQVNFTDPLLFSQGVGRFDQISLSTNNS